MGSPFDSEQLHQFESLEKLTEAFDIIIEEMPFPIAVRLSLGFHKMFQKLQWSRTPWDMDVCNGSPFSETHWKMGLQVFIRSQWTMKPDADIIAAHKFYHVLKDKVSSLMTYKDEFLRDYPDASSDVAWRALCLMCDIDSQDMPDFEVKPHYYTSSTTSSNTLILQIWHIRDSATLLPILVYSESAPGSGVQDIPGIYINRRRFGEAMALVMQLPSYGFIKYRKPAVHETTFKIDMFDLMVRKPVSNFLTMLREHAAKRPLSAVNPSSDLSSDMATLLVPSHEEVMTDMRMASDLATLHMGRSYTPSHEEIHHRAVQGSMQPSLPSSSSSSPTMPGGVMVEVGGVMIEASGGPIPPKDHVDDVAHEDHVDDGASSAGSWPSSSTRGQPEDDHVDDVAHEDHVDDVAHEDHVDDVAHEDDVDAVDLNAMD